MTIELTRRDAIAALAAAGVGVGGGMTLLDDREAVRSGPADSGTAAGGEAAGSVGDHERETMVAIAEVVYPSAVSGLDPFVGTYLDGKADREGFPGVLSRAVADLDTYATDWHGDQVVGLDPPTREALLREVGVDTADPDPTGTPAERIRFAVVNELLFALYASPTGGRLVGIENPQGHPGGLASYQRGPNG